VFPVDFGYVRAVSLRHALDELAAAPDAKLLAGGQSLLPMMKLRLAAPEALIDIGGLAELARITAGGGGGWTIGAGTTYRALGRDRALMAAYPALADALAVLADPQVRARGTAGGAIAHADPAADLPAVLLAMDAGLAIVGPGGTRTTTIDDFLRGAYTTDLAEDEILTSITLNAHPVSQAYEKFEHPASHLPLAGVCAALTVTDGAITDVRLAVTGVAARPYLVTDVTEVAAGPPDGVTVLSDQYASEQFRLHLAQVMARRAVARALERAA
jgi:aerobic carbon-monoxide dehydrogenase medium subunit